YTYTPLYLYTPILLILLSHIFTFLFFLLIRPPPTSTLFPYTTLFRSVHGREALRLRAAERNDPAGARLLHGVAGLRSADPGRPRRLDPRLVRLPRLRYLAHGFPRLRPLRQAGRSPGDDCAGRARSLGRDRLHHEDAQHRATDAGRLLVRRLARGAVCTASSRAGEAAGARRHGLYRQGQPDSEEARREALGL